MVLNIPDFAKSVKHLLLCVCMPISIQASGSTVISSQVVDATTNQPLPFSSVTIADTYYGTVANAEGFFTLDVTDYPEDKVVIINHLGYEPLRVPIATLLKSEKVILNPSTIQLSEVPVFANQLTAREILERASQNFANNHKSTASRREIFLHRFERATFPKTNKLDVKSTDFIGLDKKLIDDFMQKLPEEFVEYQDAILEWYVNDEKKILIPVEGVSLEEGSTNALMKEFEQKLNVLFEDIDKTNQEEDQYYKFRTGILAFKADKPEGSIAEAMQDTIHYNVQTKLISENLRFLLKEYANIESEYWEFINKPGRYTYSLEGLTTNNSHWVYHITFTPDRKGLFQGEVFIDSKDFGVHQVSFEFLEGRHSQRFQLLGFGHSMDYVKGHVIYQKEQDRYSVKYIKGEQQERASIDRDFKVIKKEERWLWDKTLNEISLHAEMKFNMNNYWEMLVLNNQPLEEEKLQDLEQPEYFKFEKRLVYDPEMWNKGTVIVPTTELMKYQRK